VTVVELRGVVKDYPGSPPLRVLHGVDLDIEPGERVAIVGASGSGKSTMLAIMGTLDDPTAGSVRIAGLAIGGLPERDRAELRARHIGFVFQQFFLLPALSARDNVALGMLYSGVPIAERVDRAQQALWCVGLAERAEHRPGQLSGGEQQRVAIARALVRDPDVLFADEPTGSLDSTTGDSILELLLAAGGDRTAVVIITHDQGIAARMERQVEMSDGRVVAERTRQEQSAGGAR
jgi:putative ABC transport system ATP-binding protein